MGRGFACVAAREHLVAVAGKFPDRIAISDGACAFSYSELLTIVLGLADVIAAALLPAVSDRSDTRQTVR
jgi:hypothetical protein